MFHLRQNCQQLRHPELLQHVLSEGIPNILSRLLVCEIFPIMEFSSPTGPRVLEHTKNLYAKQDTLIGFGGARLWRIALATIACHRVSNNHKTAQPQGKRSVHWC